MILWLLAMSCTAEPDRASVLLLMVDGLRPDTIGAYGDMPTQTPHLDELARKGTLFLRAYATSTLAGPAQTSILTGEPPPVHGHRLEQPPAGLEGRGWVAELVSDGWGRCDVSIDASTFKKPTTELEKCVAMPGTIAAITVRSETAKAADVAGLDETVGSVAQLWSQHQPGGLGVLVGITGSINGARPDAAIFITDDLVRIPLVVWGMGWEQGWEIGEVVSTVDVGPTVLSEMSKPSTGQSLKYGGSDLAYHESVTGYMLFRTRPLFGFTRSSGRYVEGVFGRWYPAGTVRVRNYEDPESEYGEEAARLAALRAGFSRSVGLPKQAESISVDPHERVRSMSLVSKAERLLEVGRLSAVSRIIDKIAERSPGAPILDGLRQRRDSQPAKP